jgi:predicted transcriptional regulator
VQKGEMMNIKSKPKDSHVLAVALDNLKDLLNISSEDLGQIIGVHRNTITRLLKKGEIDPKSKEGEFSLLLIRVYRSLFALNGGNKEAIRHWLTTNNRHVQGVPLETMKTVLGLSRVVNYLDAIRGKI